MKHSPSRSDNPTRTPVVRRIVAGIALFVLVLVALLVYVVQFDSGTALLWKTATRLSSGSLQGNYIKGNLRDGVTLQHIRYKDASTDVAIDYIDSSWRFGLMDRYLDVYHLRVGSVKVVLQPTPPTESSGMPDDLTIPVSLDLHNITLDKFRLEQGDTVTELNHLVLHGKSDKRTHSLTVDNLDTPVGKFVAALNLDGKKPFAIDGQASLDGAYEAENYHVATQLSGALEALNIALQASGDKLSGTANIAATPFADIPLKQATIDIKRLNPHVFGEGLPIADIAISANLAPPAGADANAPFSVAGDIAVINSMPGALDRQRLPLISAKAQVQLNATSQTIGNLAIRLVNNATINGGGQFYPAATADHAMGGDFRFEVDRLDLQALHNALKPSQLKGPVTVSLTDKTQAVTVALKDRIFDIQLAAQMNDTGVQLEKVRLAAHNAVLDVQGALQTTEAMPFKFQGTLRHFDPAFWISGGKPGAKAALNMDFDTQGVLAPDNDIKFNYSILPGSIYAGLPMDGQGKLHIAGTQLRPSQATLSVAGNDIAVNGSFGRKNDALKINVDAPHLARLGYGIAGIIKLDGEVRGATSALNIKARYDASDVRFAGFTLAQLSGHTDLQTDLDKGLASPANKITSVINLSRLRSDYVNLARLDLDVSGTSAQHTLAIASDGDISGKALQFKLAAQGKIFAEKGNYGWDGVLTTLENTAMANGLPRISLTSPLRIRAAADDITLGATRLLLADATLDLTQLRYQHGRISSQGRATSLNLATVQTLLKDLAEVNLPVKTNLVLDGEWDFALAEQARGHVQIARREGDISVVIGSAYVPVDLTELTWRMDFKQTQLLLDAVTSSKKIGNVTARGRIDLVKENGIMTIAPNSRLALQAALDVPNLAGVGNFIGPQVSLQGNINTKLNINGTVERPQLSGAVNGDRLGFTLLDQGIKLQNGTIRAVLDRNILSLDKFEFFGGQGTLTMSGKVKLDESNAAMQAQIVANKLQIFASPDRQLMLSGNAVLANIDQRLHLDGNIVIDKGLFDLPKDSAPELGSDVVIIDRNKPDTLHVKSARADDGISPIINITVNLGNDFRFKGSGADLVLTGNLTIKREQSSDLRSTGTLDARGTYEAFGAKLNIERGLINFQGALTNPSLNILAMRRNQEIEAGVEVTGNANQPRIRLVSEPNVSDEEKLSWLMFSQPSGGSSMSEAQAANQALSFLGNYGGKKIAQEFGFDQFSIGASESGLSSEQVVNIGKAISRKIMFGVEKALTAPDSVAKLTWNMSRRWSMVVRGGTINGLNVVYNLRFD